MKLFHMHYVLFICLCLGQSAFGRQQWEVSPRYLGIHKFIYTLVVTAYYTTLDANKQSADVKDWKIDVTTGANIAWRTMLYGGVNYYEAHVRNIADTMPTGWDARQNYRLSLLKTTASMITYNTRYDEAITKRHAGFNETLRPYVGESNSSNMAFGALLLTNVAWFFTVPMLWSPQVTTWLNRNTPNPTDIARAVYGHTGSNLISLATFTTLDLIFQHLLISIKHTIGGALPAPPDLRFLRFPDCTSCYFFTNGVGKNGYIGTKFRSNKSIKEEL